MGAAGRNGGNRRRRRALNASLDNFAFSRDNSATDAMQSTVIRRPFMAAQ